jgi:hypothetical protein
MRPESLSLVVVLTIIFLYININLVYDRMKRQSVQYEIFNSYSHKKHAEILNRLSKLKTENVNGSDVIDSINEEIFGTSNVCSVPGVIIDSYGIPCAVTPSVTTPPEPTPTPTPTPTEEEEEEEDGIMCLIPPEPNGSCREGTEMDDDGCCVLEGEAGPSKTEVYTDVAEQILISFLVEEIAEIFILRVLPRILVRIGSLARLGGKLMAKLVAKVSVKLAKLGTTLARKLITKSASIVGKKLAMISKSLTGGPAAAVLIAIELMFAFTDIMDPKGYSTYTENAALDKIRNSIDYNFQDYCSREGLPWPFIIPVSSLYENEFTQAYESTVADYLQGAIKYVMDSDEPSHIDIMVNMILTGLSDDSELYVSDSDMGLTEDDENKLGEIAMQLMDDNIAIRDLTLYNKLKKLVDDEEMIDIYPEVATKKQFGISLSKKGVDLWNQQNYRNYLTQDPTTLEGRTDISMGCLYTDEYRSLNISNPGTAEDPNMTIKKLSKPVPLYGLYGMLVYYCAGTKTTGTVAEIGTINPGAMGVKFNFETGKCDYSDTYCDYIGMVYYEDGDLKDCKLRPGQEEAEFILGEYMVREQARTWESRIDGFQSGDPGTVAWTTAMTLLDPTGFGTSLVNSWAPALIGAFFNKPKPEQIENTILADRSEENDKIKKEFSFLYEHDKNKYFLSDPINFTE